MELSNIFGYAGMVTGLSFMLPQVYKSWRTKRVEDVSWGMLVLLFLNCVFWFTYGFLLASTPLMLTNGIALLVVLVQIFFKIRYAKSV